MCKCPLDVFDHTNGWIIVVVQVGAVKIYVAAMEALTKKERQDETQFTTKIDGFVQSFTPTPLNANVLLSRFF